ncbi:TetR/AcrR family transcriptional regulator [Streptomyces adelaidensis]|uniref:TetR/AcrR family transcriptional regulator n=1 Tax=Streptomyces adelaidensis TaxID=2796465 RepID=UPI001905BBB6|nr:TetR/AcrR family transcriptional regulator [Streptomyces adelaidensis]
MTVGADPATPPPRRRDAQRNWELLVAAAHEVFTEQGLEAPLDVIARRAGVGNATLYRHFPSRAALIDAVFHDQLADTMAVGARARDAPDAWSGLTDYLGTVFGTLAADRGTNDLMTTHVRGVGALEAVHEHNRRTVESLLGRGRDEGSVRADVTTEDVLFGLAALGRAVPALTARAAPGAWRRPLALFLDSLRAPSPSAPPRPTLPGPSLDAAQLGEVLEELGPHRSGPARRTPATRPRG